MTRMKKNYKMYTLYDKSQAKHAEKNDSPFVEAH